METLQALIPDVEVLLALAPEELAFPLLKLARGILQRDKIGGFHPDTIGSQNGYPGNRQDEVSVALNEAWQWLRINMLILPAVGINGNNGWTVLSRRAVTITTEQDFHSFLAAAAFPKATNVVIHPME